VDGMGRFKIEMSSNMNTTYTNIQLTTSTWTLTE